MVRLLKKVKGKSFYKEPWYGSYNSMIQRCENPKSANYHLYGGRGIKICEEWHDIEQFEKWVENSNYKKGLSLDRIDVNGDYEPSNCRWATAKEQANNRRDTVYVTIDGITKTISEWADFSGINRSTINNRYNDGVRGVMLLHKAEDTTFKNGYNRYEDKGHYDDMRIKHGDNSVEIWELNGEKHSILEWSRITGINIDTLRTRKFNGWSVEKILTTPIKINKYAYKDEPFIDGRYIRQLRYEHNMTIKELAKQVGVAESTVQSWEVGKRHISMNNAKKVFDFFNILLEDVPTIIEEHKGMNMKGKN